jgi:hypothetical protein
MAHRYLLKRVGHRKPRPTIACVATIRTRGGLLVPTRCHLVTGRTGPRHEAGVRQHRAERHGAAGVDGRWQSGLRLQWDPNIRLTCVSDALESETWVSMTTSKATHTAFSRST